VSFFHSAESVGYGCQGDWKGMEGFSFHSIEDTFWNISFGANGYGVYQHCTLEHLHSIKKGLFTLALTGLVDQLSGKQNALGELGLLFQENSEYCKHQSDGNFPCISLPVRILQHEQKLMVMRRKGS
jgi:hypothetical protein